MLYCWIGYTRSFIIFVRCISRSVKKIMALHNTMGCAPNGYRFASTHSFAFSRNKNIYILHQSSLIVSLTVQLTIIHHWRTTHLWTKGQIQRHKVNMCKMSCTCNLINQYFLYHIYNVVPYKNALWSTCCFISTVKWHLGNIAYGTIIIMLTYLVYNFIRLSSYKLWQVRSCIGYPSEAHLKLETHDIFLVHNMNSINLMCWT